jgi:hypothetical protein
MVTYLRQLNRATQTQRMQFIDEGELLGALDANKVADSWRHCCYPSYLARFLERVMGWMGNNDQIVARSLP